MTNEEIIEGILFRRCVQRKFEGFTLETAKEIAAALASAGQLVGEWQPIGTAPVNTDLLLWDGNSVRSGMAKCGWKRSGIKADAYATEWMPLPSGPAAVPPHPAPDATDLTDDGAMTLRCKKLDCPGFDPASQCTTCGMRRVSTAPDAMDWRTIAKQALETLDGVAVFVKSRSQIMNPYGHEWFDARVETIRAALAANPAPDVTDWRAVAEARGKALKRIKARVCGDRIPNWGGFDETIGSRQYIADQCDAALAANPLAKEG